MMDKQIIFHTYLHYYILTVSERLFIFFYLRIKLKLIKQFLLDLNVNGLHSSIFFIAYSMLKIFCTWRVSVQT